MLRVNLVRGFALSGALVALTFVFSFIIRQDAHAGMRFSLFGAGTYSKYTLEVSNVSVNSSAKLGYGGGMMFEFPLGKVVSLDLGAAYLVRKSEILTITQTVPIVMAPLQLRFWLNRYFILGVGGYYSYVVGNVKSKTAAGIETTYTAAQGNMSKTDYGLIGSLGLNIPMGKSVSLLAEGWYAYGLHDTDTIAGSKTLWNDIVGIVGLRFGGVRK